ncbi:nucleotidyltransferase family protein [Arcobacter sp. FWKO B]|uniref:nucleotidyltransferase family protein n=1 Tax=Arcobacter sp. FWKO B TaxID=2593672 RepID=UPI001D18BCC2|nr:nucleotidyltransferase domain-containing protein [Arcobacter sp. FWKO B]
MTKTFVLNFLSSHKQLLKEKYDVEKIGLFGSYATDNQKESSDIDIIVQMPSDFDKYYDLKEFLETKLEKRVDLGLEKNLRKLIENKVKNEIIYV